MDKNCLILKIDDYSNYYYYIMSKKINKSISVKKSITNEEEINKNIDSIQFNKDDS